MAYTRGSNANIIVGAAALFTYEDGELANGDLPAYVDGRLTRQPFRTMFRSVT
jgi:hypothetical protein